MMLNRKDNNLVKYVKMHNEAPISLSCVRIVMRQAMKYNYCIS